jgi:hypothetical protein
MAPAMKFDHEVYHFYQTQDAPSSFTATTSTPGIYSVAPALNNILAAQLSALQGVFDQYKIVECEVWCEAQRQGGSGTTPIDQIAGKLYSVVDYDDAANLSTVGQAMSYTNCVVSSFEQGHYRRWRPRIAMAAYQGALTAFANMAAQWIDIAYPNVAHYGMKFITDLSSSTSNISFDIRLRILVACRNTR